MTLPLREPHTVECAWCTRPAQFTVHAQWTIFDFDDIVACGEHILAAFAMFERRRVDGQRVVDMWSTELWQVHPSEPYSM